MSNKLDGKELVERVLRDNQIYRFEGVSGVQNLCRVAKMLGYSDTMYLGQFKDGCYGDLIDFLEDNPGACRAIIDWIGKVIDSVPEWQHEFESYLAEDSDNEVEDD